MIYITSYHYSDNDWFRDGFTLYVLTEKPIHADQTSLFLHKVGQKPEGWKVSWLGTSATAIEAKGRLKKANETVIECDTILDAFKSGGNHCLVSMQQGFYLQNANKDLGDWFRACLGEELKRK